MSLYLLLVLVHRGVMVHLAIHTIVASRLQPHCIYFVLADARSHDRFTKLVNLSITSEDVYLCFRS